MSKPHRDRDCGDCGKLLSWRFTDTAGMCRIKLTFRDCKGNDIKTIEANEGDDILSLAHEHNVDLEGGSSTEISISIIQSSSPTPTLAVYHILIWPISLCSLSSLVPYPDPILSRNLTGLVADVCTQAHANDPLLVPPVTSSSNHTFTICSLNRKTMRMICWIWHLDWRIRKWSYVSFSVLLSHFFSYTLPSHCLSLHLLSLHLLSFPLLSLVSHLWMDLQV